ncbi:MAG TPA: DUF1254 domain-containing protein [Pirellulales bacterium]|nr:DUF1254 domain-containing protein [Pirellulales bacterium]
MTAQQTLPAMAAMIAAIAPAVSTGPARAEQTASATDTDHGGWREQYAYTLGVQAYIYGFPYVYMSELRWLWVTQPINPEHMPYAPLNQFWHARTLGTAEYQDGGSPNNDTMYSIAWLDLSKEPVILSVPDVGSRYYTIEIGGFDADNFAYVGTRATGSGEGNYAIVGPNWVGTLPDGVKSLPPSATQFALIIGRTLVDGPNDVEAVHKLMAHYKLTSLSCWGSPTALAPPDRNVWKPFDRKSDPLAEWKTINHELSENPQSSRDALLLEQFARIGVGAGLDVEKLDEPTKRGLARAAVDARKLMEASNLQGWGMKVVGGWKYPPQDIGRGGQHGDFLTRGAVQSMLGILANDPEEAVYLNTATDEEGNPLDGAHRYIIRFAAGELPKVKAFWSVTLYDAQHNLARNPISRYSIGDRSPGLQRDEDGGLTIYVQNTPPEPGKESNWLPAPTGAFNLMLRCYLPSEEILEQRWSPPPLRRVD